MRMEIPLAAELEDKLNRIASQTGKGTGQIVEELVANYFDHDEWFRREAMPHSSLESRFDDAMHELYGRIVREAKGYTPSVFFRMIEEYGGLEAARRLLRPDADFFSYGFDHLSQMGRSDLTMEALILSLDYKDQLFTPRELTTAEERLQAAQQLYPPRA